MKIATTEKAEFEVEGGGPGAVRLIAKMGDQKVAAYLTTEEALVLAMLLETNARKTVAR